MFSKAVIATLLASTAAATPIAARDASNAFGLIAIRSGSDLQYKTINANGGRLWIGKETASYCPEEQVGAACPAGNVTTFVAQPNQLVGLNDVVPGGQQLYIGTDNSVSYTIAHSADTFGGKAQGWQYTAAPVGLVGSLTFDGYTFFACASPEGPGIYSIDATSTGEATGNCTSIALGAPVYNGPATAWQYQ
ncbi:hypothetical protein ACMFMG_006867 [Clarireedia jacksonii]